MAQSSCEAIPIDALKTEETLPEVSVVMPCLNEEDTLDVCIEKTLAAFSKAGIAGEVIIADNGSVDRSREIAEKRGARVIDVAARGYGNALMGGIEAARGRYVIMGDADDSYDFGAIPEFVKVLRTGASLVQGCRLPSGGGVVLPGAMPFLHRWWGNPMFSWLARRWFGAPIHDVYCGLRGFSRELYDRLDLRCTGMEFATEMIIKASLYNEVIAEVPVTLSPDGRKTRPPHLRTFRDGWRTLRFFIMYSPKWLFIIPGLILCALGAVGYAIALPGVTINHIHFDVHTLLFASLAILCGYQSLQFAVFTKTFAMSEHLIPRDERLLKLLRTVNLEVGLVVGAVALFGGIALLVGAVNQWRAVDFGHLDYSHTMRWVIPGATLTALGFQTVLASFFLSILGMTRRG